LTNPHNKLTAGSSFVGELRLQPGPRCRSREGQHQQVDADLAPLECRVMTVPDDLHNRLLIDYRVSFRVKSWLGLRSLLTRQRIALRPIKE
jgi:hypothetical protein